MRVGGGSGEGRGRGQDSEDEFGLGNPFGGEGDGGGGCPSEGCDLDSSLIAAFTHSCAGLSRT